MDTGADISVFPASLEDKKRMPSTPLAAANGTRIGTWGKRAITLCFGNKYYTETFIVADVTRPILGARFFVNNDMVIDLKRRTLTEGASWHAHSKVICSIQSSRDDSEWKDILR